MTAPAVPDLWLDWCVVTGTDTSSRDEATIARFTKQAQPSLAVLRMVRPRHRQSDQYVAPAWPAALKTDSSSLRRLIQQGCIVHDHPGSDWALRLRIRRLLFAAVLISPTDQGGLGLTRGQLLAMRPEQLLSASSRIGTDDDPLSCPALLQHLPRSC